MDAALSFDEHKKIVHLLVCRVYNVKSIAR